MIWTFLVLSVVVGLIRGGKISRLSGLKFQSLWLFILALAIQAVIILFGVNTDSIVLEYIKELYVASYALLFIGIILNIKIRSLIVIALGAISNILVFAVNKGKIPISMEGLKLAGYNDLIELLKNGEIALYTPLTSDTKYAYLSKLITIQKPYPFPQVLSIGDVIIALGLFIFIQSVMLNPNLTKSNMLKFGYKNKF
ncbi:MAG: hypothetical protein FH753_14225 [Firmicutes bacterium]|nr:hypothetical protein [Bacillota bacterium]